MITLLQDTIRFPQDLIFLARHISLTIMHCVDTSCCRAICIVVWRGNIFRNPFPRVTSLVLFTMYTIISMIIYAANMHHMHTAGDNLPKKEKKRKKLTIWIANRLWCCWHPGRGWCFDKSQKEWQGKVAQNGDKAEKRKARWPQAGEGGDK